MIKPLSSIAGERGPGTSVTPCQGTKIPHALWPPNQDIKQKQYCNKFNKRFKSLQAINAGEGVGLIPGWGAEIPHALGSKNQNIKQKQYCNKFNKNFKNSPY